MKLNCEGVSIFQCIVSEVLVTAAATATTCLRYATKKYSTLHRTCNSFSKTSNARAEFSCLVAAFGICRTV